jgi:CRP-like cAMP-binding protein
VIPQPIDQVPLFLRLTEDERELVTARLKRRQAANGEIIFSAGEASDAMYVIISGRVKLEGGKADSSLTLANLGAASLLGEEDTFLDPTSRI